MSEESNEFSLEDFMSTPREKFEVPEDVFNTLKAMLVEINAFCRTNKIPFVATAVIANDDENYHLNTSMNFPLGRFPEELLLFNEMARGGVTGMLGLLDVLHALHNKANEGSIIV